MRMALLVLCHIAIVLNCQAASGHSGRTDASGGHHDRKNGGYHYHGGGGGGGGNSTPAYNTGRGSESRTEPRTTPRTTGRTGSALQKLIEDPERAEPDPPRIKEDSAASLNLSAELDVQNVQPIERHLPKFEVLDKVQTDEGLVVHVQLDDSPGIPRPTESDVVEIHKKLGVKNAVKMEFVWKRGRYQHVTWAESKESGSESPVAKIKQDTLDFDILSERVSATSKTHIEAVIHRYRDSFPPNIEVRELFEDLKIKGDCSVRFFWPLDHERKHVCAQVVREKRRLEPQISLYPRSSALHK